MFQDIINYGNRQGGKQAIADFGPPWRDMIVINYLL